MEGAGVASGRAMPVIALGGSSWDLRPRRKKEYREMEPQRHR